MARPGISEADVALLADPDSGGPLVWRGTTRDGLLHAGVLRCDDSQTQWCVEDGLPRMYRPDLVTGPDALMRTIYDAMPGLHDPGVRYGMPLYGGGTEKQIRNGYMSELALGSLKPRADGQPIRILEVSIGTGANLGLLYRDLPDGLPVEIWGIDISAGMMQQCARKIAKKGLESPDGSHIRMLMADAHALPFQEGIFDRVFHVGGIAAFRDQALAMREMARVARPGTPIVVVDEALDPDDPGNAYNRLMFKLLTFWDPDPHVPREHVPFQAEITCDKQVSRFYYCLTFKMPDGASATG